MEHEAATLRQMLDLLDQIEALMDDGAYSEAGEKRIATLRKQWMKELADVEFQLVVTWTGMPRTTAH
jgi:hypothetical protein